jgi:hypothetical protein
MSKNAAEPGNSPATRVVHCVGASLRIKGNIPGNEDLLVEGMVKGPVHHRIRAEDCSAATRVWRYRNVKLVRHRVRS